MPTADINGHRMYWEVHGEGEWLICMGGWGSFCHGEHRHAPRALLASYRVLIFDYPGLEESSMHDDADPSTALYADDLAELADRVGIERAHVVGMVGMGGCVAQQLALRRPDLVRSLVLVGTWGRVDPLFADQLELFRAAHESLGFPGFQLLAATLSFDPTFYAERRERILGERGAWWQLRGRYAAHARLIHACRGHDVLDELGRITAPTLVVHAGADVVTGPRLTRPLEEAIPDARGVLLPDAPHVIAGRDAKIAFERVIVDYLAGVEATRAG